MDIYTFSLSPSPKFDCTPYPNPKLIVELDLTESVDPNSVPLKYIWTFDDGEVLEGEKLSKTFKYPGQQNIKIDIIDLISGKRETEEIIETIYLNDINYIGFKHEPVTQVDTNTIFDATISFVENSEFIEYYWSINDSVLETNQAIASYSFSDTGKYTVKMQVDVLTDGSDLNTYCYEDSIFVLSKEAYARYIPIIKIEEEQGLNTPDTLLAVSTTSDTSLFVNSIDLNNLLAKKDSITFDPIYFNFDKYDLTPEAQDKLDEIIVYLANNPSRNIIVYGHTDAMGSDEYNLRLSKKRANVSVAYLRSKGLKMSRIVKTVNLGETQPAKANKLPNGADNVEGRRLNRRVEFVIIY
jgi:outer membrane protein OmpA-like peptidoglycan-associated protein